MRVAVRGRVQVVEESDKKTAADVLAEIGGYLGLFVGISLVTVLEFFLFLLSLFFDFFSSLCSATPASPKSASKKRTSPVGASDGVGEGWEESQEMKRVF